MLTKSMLLKLFQYNHDTNLRLLELAANLSPEQCAAPQKMAATRSPMVVTFIAVSLSVCSGGV